VYHHGSSLLDCQTGELIEELSTVSQGGCTDYYSGGRSLAQGAGKLPVVLLQFALSAAVLILALA